MRFRAWPGIAAVALTASLAGGAAADLITKNKPAPAWSGVTVAGKPISSVHYKGKVVLLNFFSYTWTACHEEYPHLQELQQKYGAKGFSVVSVSGDEQAEDAGAFAKEIKATFPVVHDKKLTVSDRYGVLGLPANLVIGRNGKVVYSAEGEDVKALKAAVAKAVQAQ